MSPCTEEQDSEPVRQKKLRRYNDQVTSFVPEELDLNDLRRQLEERFGDLPPGGYIQGKTALRAAVVEFLQCSELEAEQLIDTLEAHGVVRYEGDRSDKVDDLESRWLLGSS